MDTRGLGVVLGFLGLFMLSYGYNDASFGLILLGGFMVAFGGPGKAKVDLSDKYPWMK